MVPWPWRPLTLGSALGAVLTSIFPYTGTYSKPFSLSHLSLKGNRLINHFQVPLFLYKGTHFIISFSEAFKAPLITLNPKP